MDHFITFIIHHWALWLALVLVVGLIIFLEFKERFYGVVSVNPHQATQLINREHATVLDIRTPDEFKQGHIIDAKNIISNDLPNQLPGLEHDKNKPIIIVCYAGQSSLKAGKLLLKHGLTKVYSLKGGLNAWREAKLPVVKSK